MKSKNITIPLRYVYYQNKIHAVCMHDSRYMYLIPLSEMKTLENGDRYYDANEVQPLRVKEEEVQHINRKTIFKKINSLSLTNALKA